MYDASGNGICCADGNGEYVITSNGIILAQGREFGLIEEMFFELPASLSVKSIAAILRDSGLLAKTKGTG